MTKEKWNCDVESQWTKMKKKGLRMTKERSLCVG
jgi:hypothetical protein